MVGGYKRKGASYTRGRFMLMYGKNHHNIVIILQLKIKYKLKKLAVVNKSMAFGTFYDA